ncbi:hypothetical protein Sme01_03340 [Sphaerisporangium melleum]|uniref:Uncharacterized protein n=1 Tax=Sphaerisporangium melleum TaxID=321316 RepID=A0A917QPG9_9ACTN|nr:hypothetical protein [Sphaerisporangium melleum]GGK61585.1 hypothetical protein GCM10007964_00890 [Sphaerisporangium melleum]GII67858.1 hypothetical protein Sme01_03340 [Sphaerisporangium melleum]
MSEHICPGRCNSRFRDEWDAYHRAVDVWQAVLEARAKRLADNPHADLGTEPERPAEPTRRPWTGEPLWCGNDAAAVRSALADLDELMALHLAAGDGYGTGSAQERVSSSPEPASPSPKHDDQDELLEWLAVWEQSYRESQGWPAKPYRGVSAPALTSAVAWLTGHLDAILAHPDLAEGFGTGVLGWHSRLEAATKTRVKPRWMPRDLRCHQCHAKTLAQLEGEDRVECRNPSCGEARGGPVVMTLDEYNARVDGAKPAARLARMAAAAERVPTPFPDYGLKSGRA